MGQVKRRKTSPMDTEVYEELQQNLQEPTQEESSTLAKKEPLYTQSSENTASSPKHNAFSLGEYLLLLALFTLAAFCTRWYRISAGNFVLWDEAHFGKFGAYYLKRTYYTDVHPPLAKMLVGLAEYLAGFDGKSFKFESSKTYPESVNYIAMRMFLSGLGALVVPLMFAAAHHLGLSKNASLLIGLVVLFDVGLVGICRPILLDSSLLFFTAMTLLFLVKQVRQKYAPFGVKWCMNLLALGAAIGFAASSKWVGLFSVATVGLFTIWELLGIWSDRRNSIPTFIAHFLARALFLIVVPVGIYCSVFWVHFAILNRSGPGDGQMSALFQAGLKDSKIAHCPLGVVYGSTVSIKSKSRFAGNLHSHVQRYPNGSGQQQVTIYHHRDQNNYWVLSKASPDWQQANEELQPVRNGDKIRLTHSSTLARLHSHRLRSWVTTSDFEVSGYGDPTVQDPNDEWIVEFVGKEQHSAEASSLKTLFTDFKLKHAHLGCYLRYSTKHYPDWAFKQGEVTCSRVPGCGRECIWSVEENIHASLPAPEEGCYKSSFWDDFIDLNVNMYRSNNSLTPDPDVHPTGLTSSPVEWPLLIRGIRMSAWEDGKIRFYMFANPLSGWMCLGGLVAAASLVALRFFGWQRNGNVLDSRLLEYLPKFFVGLLGWSLHYFSFFVMGRVLYFHHYYPAYLFAILNLGVGYDYLLEGKRGWVSEKLKRRLFMGAVWAVVGTFAMFSPLAYGMEGSVADYWYLKWLPQWM